MTTWTVMLLTHATLRLLHHTPLSTSPRLNSLPRPIHYWLDLRINMHEGLCIIMDTSCIFKFRTNYLSCVSECVIIVLSTLCYWVSIILTLQLLLTFQLYHGISVHCFMQWLGEEMHGVWSRGSKTRGRPKRTWREVVKEDCEAHKLNTENAMDRSKWRKLIKDVRWSGWVWLWVGECFFWYQPTRVVPD